MLLDKRRKRSPRRGSPINLDSLQLGEVPDNFVNKELEKQSQPINSNINKLNSFYKNSEKNKTPVVINVIKKDNTDEQQPPQQSNLVQPQAIPKNNQEIIHNKPNRWYDNTPRRVSPNTYNSTVYSGNGLPSQNRIDKTQPFVRSPRNPSFAPPNRYLTSSPRNSSPSRNRYNQQPPMMQISNKPIHQIIKREVLPSLYPSPRNQSQSPPRNMLQPSPRSQSPSRSGSPIVPNQIIRNQSPTRYSSPKNSSPRNLSSSPINRPVSNIQNSRPTYINNKQSKLEPSDMIYSDNRGSPKNYKPEMLKRYSPIETKPTQINDFIKNRNIDDVDMMNKKIKSNINVVVPTLKEKEIKASPKQLIQNHYDKKKSLAPQLRNKKEEVKEEIKDTDKNKEIVKKLQNTLKEKKEVVVKDKQIKLSTNIDNFKVPKTVVKESLFLKNKDNLSFFSKLPDVSDKYLCTILSDGISIKKQTKDKQNVSKDTTVDNQNVNENDKQPENQIDDGNFKEKPNNKKQKSADLDNKVAELK